jgi:hypothetical protein
VTAHPGTVQIIYGTVPQSVWDQLLALGYTGDPNDGVEALYPPQVVLDRVLGRAAGVANASATGLTRSPAGVYTLQTLYGIRPELMTVLDYGQSVSAFIGNQLTSAALTRSTSQAATLKLGFADPKRTVLTSPLLTQKVTIDTGAWPSVRFTLVQVSKSGDDVTATFEDTLVNRLRGITGQVSAAPGVLDRVAFAAQLCREAGVPIYAPPPGATPLAAEPLTRGTSETPDEDTWSCLNRLAQDVNYQCFSDTQSIYFGPDSWFQSWAVSVQIAEFSDLAGQIDFDYDIGKPVATATVHTYADKWPLLAGVGAHAELLDANAASGSYLITEISRDLFSSPTQVKLERAEPVLPEPAGTSATTLASS